MSNPVNMNTASGPSGTGPGSGTGRTGTPQPGGSLEPPGHSFLSSGTEVRNMETALISLLNSFHSGELSAFGPGRSLETMEAIRARQEALAKLHFDLGSAKQGDSTQNWLSEADQNKLVAGLRELSVEIEKLHETSS